VPASIQLADGFLSYQLTSNDRVDDSDEPTMVAEYAFDVYAPSLLPWPPPSEEQKAPGRAALGRIRQAVDSAQRDWESNDFAAVVQKLEKIEREASRPYRIARRASQRRHRNHGRVPPNGHAVRSMRSSVGTEHRTLSSCMRSLDGAIRKLAFAICLPSADVSCTEPSVPGFRRP